MCGCMIVVTQRRHTNHNLVKVTPCHNVKKACTPRICLYNLVLHVHLLTLCVKIQHLATQASSCIMQVMCTHRQTSTDVLSDYCDGKCFREHPLFSVDPMALQLILYYDELELCNPLGSRRKKHKIGMLFTASLATLQYCL